jgi:hypothetical protein
MREIKQKTKIAVMSPGDTVPDDISVDKVGTKDHALRNTGPGGPVPEAQAPCDIGTFLASHNAR